MKKYQEYLPLKEHYKAINGETPVYLSGDYGKFDEQFHNYPWEYTTSIDDGASWRYNMPVSYRFEAEVGGLSFCWSLDIETRESRNSGGLRFDFDLFRRVAALLPIDARHQFATRLTKNMQLFDAQVQSLRESYLSLVLHRNSLEETIGSIMVDMAPETEEAKAQVEKWRNER